MSPVKAMASKKVHVVLASRGKNVSTSTTSRNFAGIVAQSKMNAYISTRCTASTSLPSESKGVFEKHKLVITLASMGAKKDIFQRKDRWSSRLKGGIDLRKTQRKRLQKRTQSHLTLLVQWLCRAQYGGLLYILQGIKPRSFEELTIRAHDIEQSITSQDERKEMESKLFEDTHLGVNDDQCRSNEGLLLQMLWSQFCWSQES
ncbi:unnamed protein product [Prunus brigantina]